MGENRFTPNCMKDKQEYNVICNGFGCLEIASEVTIENVGHFGKIKLDLCANCIRKFRKNKKVIEKDEGFN